MKKFNISVVIPLYNKGSRIKATIESILDQTYSPAEIIIVDDGSTDNSSDFVTPYLSDARIHFIQQENSGPGAARNKGMDMASSEWISVLQPGWAWAAYRPSRMMERLIATASVDQRCVLGFPAPGHDYWTSETIEAVKARYGSLGFDASPYREGLGQ